MKKKRKNNRVSGTLALAVAALVLVDCPVAAQDRPVAEGHTPASGLRAELLLDVDVLESKYTGLADVLAEHSAWRPADGVRSVREVLAHLAGANLLLPIALGVDPPEGIPAPAADDLFARMAALERTTDYEAVVELLGASFDHLRHVITSVGDDVLDETVPLFGQEFTRRQALVGMVTHAHEHLGQLVAYARMNAVVPPWSTGG